MTKPTNLDPVRMVVVGVGGIGTWLSEGLARMLEFRAPNSMLVLVDGDTFEDKNRERQSFNDIGNKAMVTANSLQQKFPNTFIVPVAAWVVDDAHAQTEVEEGDKENNVTKISGTRLLEDGDLVYVAVDNSAARKVLLDAAEKLNNIDVFIGGNDDGLDGTIYHYRRRNGADVTDHPRVWHDEYINPKDKNPGELSCEERARLEGGTQLIAVNMAVAAYLLGRTQKTIIENTLGNESKIYFDLGAGAAVPYDLPADQVQEQINEPIPARSN